MYYIKDNLICLFLLLIISVPSAYGQKQKKYSGKYQNLKQEEGMADFFYLQEPGSDNIILNGSFYFEINRIDSLLPIGLDKKKYSGTYANNLKEGLWNYELASLNFHLKEIDGYNLKISQEGNIKKLRGNYKKGLMDGSWQLVEDLYENGQIRKNLKTGNAHFKDGLMTGIFSFHAEDTSFIKIAANIDNKGFLHGQIILEYAEKGISVHETREYQNGFLKLLLKKNKASGDTIAKIIYDDVISQLGQAGNPASYSISPKLFTIHFNNGYSKENKKLTEQYRGNSILSSAMATFHSEVSLNKELKGQKESTLAGTARFYYPISKEEIKKGREVKAKADTLKNHITTTLSDPVLKIYHQRNDTLEKVYKSLNENKILIDALTKNMEEYLSEEGRFKNPLLLYYAEIEELQKKHHKSIEDTARSSSVAEIAGNLLLAVKSEIIAQSSLLTPLVNQIKKENYSQELESLILSSNEDLQKLYLGTSERESDLNYLQKHIFEKFVMDEIKKQTQKYSRLTDLDEKKKLGEDIIDLQNSLKNLYEPLGKIPEMRKKLDEIYTYYAYNPYMDRYDIKTRKKPRLYSGLHEVWSCLENLITSENDIEKLNVWTNKIMSLYDKAIELESKSDKETKRLEQKLKKEKDFSSRLQLLQL
ncbi:MAG: hypothetical protein ACK40G_15180 [Cytophagaceae bacterium]